MSGLFKSRTQYNRQCPRRLWLQAYRPGLEEADPTMQMRLDVGNQRGGHPNRFTGERNEV